MNDTSMLGHNTPPRDSIVAAKTWFDVLREFLSLNPKVDNEEVADEAGKIANQTKSCLANLETERDSLVRPLNAQVGLINSEFKLVREPMEKLRDELGKRMAVWLSLKDVACQEELESAKAELAAARQELDQADLEEADSDDYGAAVIKTQKAIDRVKDAENRLRAAMANDRARISGGDSGRSISLRSVETLVVEDAVAAITDILAHGEMPEKLSAAILTAAREFRKTHGELPAGVVSHTIKKV